MWAPLWSVAALLPTGILLYITSTRLFFPYELNGMESDTLYTAKRVLSGHFIYAAPRLEFASEIYTPLLFYFSAPFVWLVGNTPVAPRILAFLAILAVFAYLFLFVYRETRSVAAAFMGLGLFSLYFPAGDGLLGVARPDTPMTALFLAAVYHGRDIRTTRGFFLTAFLWLLAFHTKQTVLVLSPLLFLYWLAIDKKRGAALIGILAASVLLVTVVLNLLSEGWYVFYVFQRNSRAHHDYARIAPFLWRGVFWQFAVPLLFAAYFSAHLLRSHRYRGTCYFGFALLGMIAGFAFLKTHIGSAGNSYLAPLHGLIAVLGAIGFHTLWGALARVEKPIYRWTGRLLPALLLLCHMAAFAYGPAAYLPGPNTLAAWRHLESTVAGLEGDVFLERHEFIAERSGKAPVAHASAFQAIWLMNGHDQIRNETDTMLREAMASGRFDAFVIKEHYFKRHLVELGLEEGYYLAEKLAVTKDKDRKINYFGPRLVYKRKPE